MAAHITAGPIHALPPHAHSAAGAVASSAAAEEADDEEPETLPLLARRVMAGRQSIAPHHKVLYSRIILISNSMGSLALNMRLPWSGLCLQDQPFLAILVLKTQCNFWLPPSKHCVLCLAACRNASFPPSQGTYVVQAADPVFKA